MDTPAAENTRPTGQGNSRPCWTWGLLLRAIPRAPSPDIRPLTYTMHHETHP